LGCALLALSAAAASSNHNTVPSGKLRGVPPAPGSTSFTAVIAANGQFKRGNGVTAVSQPDGKGTYEVDFTNDVTGCAYVATIGQTTSAGFQPAGFITVVGRSGTPQGVYVETQTLGGKLKNFPFHLDVGC